MIKKIFFIAIAFSLFILACKKKKTTQEGTNNTYTAPVDGTITNATSFFGLFAKGSYSDDN